MSYWEDVPFDILTLILPYLTGHIRSARHQIIDLSSITKLCLDSYVRRRLDINNPNGFIWKFLFTQNLSRNLSLNSVMSFRDIYHKYIIKIGNWTSILDMRRLLKWALKMGYEILVQDLLENYETNDEKVEALLIATKYGHLNIVQYLIKDVKNTRDHRKRALDVALKRGHVEIAEFLMDAQ